MSDSTWYANTLARLDQRGEREVQELSLGPVTVDVTSARAIGWSDETIALVAHAMYLAVRGANTSTDYSTGRGCESCGRVEPRHPDCGVCR